jgi:hypothetical protein
MPDGDDPLPGAGRLRRVHDLAHGRCVRDLRPAVIAEAAADPGGVEDVASVGDAIHVLVVDGLEAFARGHLPVNDDRAVRRARGDVFRAVEPHGAECFFSGGLRALLRELALGGPCLERLDDLRCGLRDHARACLVLRQRDGRDGSDRDQSDRRERGHGDYGQHEYSAVDAAHRCADPAQQRVHDDPSRVMPRRALLRAIADNRVEPLTGDFLPQLSLPHKRVPARLFPAADVAGGAPWSRG